MNSTGNDAKIAELEALLRRIYALVEYARSKRDTAPIALGNYPGHVEDDLQFREQRDRLKQDVRLFFERERGGEFEYQRLLSRLEHLTPEIPHGMSPGWKGLLRCRCWWDVKDELQSIADYLGEKLAEHSSHNQAAQTGGVNITASGDTTVAGDVVGRDKIIINIFKSAAPEVTEALAGLGRAEVAVLLEVYKRGGGNTVTGAVDIEKVGQNLNIEPSKVRSICRFLEDERLIQHFEDTGRLFVITHQGVKKSRLLMNASGISDD